MVDQTMLLAGIVALVALLAVAGAASLVVLRRMRARSREIHDQIVELNDRLAERVRVVDDKITGVHQRLQAVEEQEARDRNAFEQVVAEIGARLDEASARLVEVQARLQSIEFLDLGERMTRVERLQAIDRAAALVTLASADDTLTRDTSVALLRHLAELGAEIEASRASEDEPSAAREE